MRCFFKQTQSRRTCHRNLGIGRYYSDDDDSPGRTVYAEAVVAVDDGRGERIGRGLLDDEVYLAGGIVGEMPLDVEVDAV